MIYNVVLVSGAQQQSDSDIYRERELYIDIYSYSGFPEKQNQEDVDI